jgi:hypothetical protein
MSFGDVARSPSAQATQTVKALLEAAAWPGCRS